MVNTRSIIHNQRAAKATVDPLIDAVDEFGSVLAEVLDGRFKLDSMRNTKFLRDYATKRVGMINRTTIRQLKSALAKAEDPEEAVRSVFRHAREVRAAQIAATEVTRTSNWAAIEAGRQSGIELKQWMSMQDSHVRHTHTVLHGQIVGINEDFVSPSGERAKAPGLFPSASETIGCRCAAIALKGKRKVSMEPGEAPVDAFDDFRRPFEKQMEKAWRDVFEEQELLLLDELS